MVLFKIAFRNLREHKTKTVIIGTIIAVGIMVLVIGNSMMDTAAKGIKQTFWDNYTGHIFIAGSKKGDLTIFGPVRRDSMNSMIPKIPDYFKVKEYLSGLEEVKNICPLAFGNAIVKLTGDNVETGEDDVQTFTMLFGIDPLLYRKTFPSNMKILAGSFIKEGESGIMLSRKVANYFKSTLNREIKPGDSLLLTSMNDISGMKIREVTVRGIFEFKEADPMLSMVSLVDINNLRALTGMNVSSVKDIKLSGAEEQLMGNINDEQLFGEASVVANVVKEKGKVSEKSLLDILGSDEKITRVKTTGDSGAWHFILLKLKDPSRIKRTIIKINKYFDSNGIDAKAYDWMMGAGMIAQLSANMKYIFNVIVLIIAIVAIIIIMNTIVISVTERISEIGTMRAIGAQKSFIRRMIIVETLMISLIFGVIGIALGAGVLVILGSRGIVAPNMFFQILFGGRVLHPVISGSSVVLSLVVVVLIGIVASLYPVMIALRIQPVKAMQRG